MQRLALALLLMLLLAGSAECRKKTGPGGGSKGKQPKQKAFNYNAASASGSSWSSSSSSSSSSEDIWNNKQSQDSSSSQSDNSPGSSQGIGYSTFEENQLPQPLHWSDSSWGDQGDDSSSREPASGPVNQQLTQTLYFPNTDSETLSDRAKAVASLLKSPAHHGPELQKAQPHQKLHQMLQQGKGKATPKPKPTQPQAWQVPDLGPFPGNNIPKRAVDRLIKSLWSANQQQHLQADQGHHQVDQQSKIDAPKVPQINHHGGHKVEADQQNKIDAPKVPQINHHGGHKVEADQHNVPNKHHIEDASIKLPHRAKEHHEAELLLKKALMDAAKQVDRVGSERLQSEQQAKGWINAPHRRPDQPKGNHRNGWN